MTEFEEDGVPVIVAFHAHLGTAIASAKSVEISGIDIEWPLSVEIGNMHNRCHVVDCRS